MERNQEMSPRGMARLGGLFYLLIFLVGIFSEFAVRGRLVTDGDGAATAHNILAHPALYRMGGLAELTVLLCDTCVALIFYELFKPVSRRLSLFATVFRLMLVAIMAVNVTNYFVPLNLLNADASPNAFSAAQLQTLVMKSLQAYGRGYEIALVFFGIHCLIIGFLILRSTFLPRILGVLMALAGLGWLSFSWPPVAYRMYPYILLPGVVGEGLLTLWLLTMGVNAERWREQSGAPAGTS